MRVLAVAVFVSAMLGTAAAQAPSDAEEANRLFLEGRDLLTSNNTEAACEKFEESIALDPAAPGVMLNLGLCYELLEKYATSLYWFRKAQVGAAEAKMPAYEDEAKRHTVALATKVTILKLDTSAAPPNTEIRIDGKLIPPTDYARVEVDRGEHELEARAQGKQPYQHSFDVTSTGAKAITIPALVDLDNSVIDPPPGGTPSSNLGRTVLAAGFGAAGLGLCIGAPLWARSVKREYDAAVANMENPSYPTARNKQHIATGLFVAGLGLIGFGTYLYLTMPASNGTPTTAIVPVLDAQQVGIAITGAL
ncbi:MAG TPA: hypothetical protein VIV11_09395 [Kofleriaceae bacterium]